MAVQLRGINLGKKTKIFIYLLAIISLVFVIAKVYIYQTSKYITVGNTTYSKQQYNDYKDYLLLQQISDKDVDKQIVQRLKIIEFAKKNNIDITSQETKKKADELKKTLSNVTKKEYGDAYKFEAQYVQLSSSIYNPKYQGYYYEFYFGQHIAYSDKNKPEGLNDPRLIEQDRSYAKQRAEYYKSAIKNGSIEPDQALSEILNDPKLGNNKIINNYSTKIIDTPDALYNESARDLIYSNQWKGLSEIKVSATQIEPGLNKPKKDMYFYFVYLTEAPSTRLNTKQTNQQISSIKVIYNK